MIPPVGETRGPLQTADGRMDEATSDHGWSWPKYRLPAFRAADLRLVGDMYSDPVTTAVRNDALAFPVPTWSDDARQVLVVLGDRLSDAVAVAVRKGALRFAETLDWSKGLLSLEIAFGLERRLHLFRAEPPVAWATFSESQLTKGFAHFLNAPDDVTRIERVRALLKALGAPELSNAIFSEVMVTAEAPTSGNKRIDLLIEWKDSSKRSYAVAIEAKLGHHVTSGQLPAYRNHLRNIAEMRRLLVVVSPRLTGRTGRSLQRNRDWRWTAWRDLLVGHERALADCWDDNAYAQFRRTLWDHTG